MTGPALVLDSTRRVVDRARDVRIDDDAVRRWAANEAAGAPWSPQLDLPAALPGTHAQLANLVLLIDALNFCFWSPRPIHVEWRGRRRERFEAMFVSLMETARRDPRWFDARQWCAAAPEEIRQALVPSGELLMMPERERIVREIGAALLERFDGQFVHAVESVNHRAWPLAVLLMTNFDSFRDVSRHEGRPVYFMKRAQICALDLSVAWQTHDHPPLEGLEELTAFADYRVPQTLRHLGILRLSDELADRIERKDEIETGSAPEVELRAATVQAVERMRAAAAERGDNRAAWQIDWRLWSDSHRENVVVQHHRTRTIYY